MRKATKKLLTFALSTLFVGAGIGVVKTINAENVNIALAEETASAVSLDGTFTPLIAEGAQYASDGSYAYTVAHLTSTVPFADSLGEGGVYLNDHADSFGIDLMDYILINGKSARQIYNERGGDAGALADYPDNGLIIEAWAPVVVHVWPQNGGTQIRVFVDRRYVPTASLEITLKACELTSGGTTYKLSADETYKSTIDVNGTYGANARKWISLKKESEVEETAIENPFIRAAKWDDHGNYYRLMVTTSALTLSTNYQTTTEFVWVMDNYCYFQDYMLVNGRTIAEIQIADSKDGIDFTGSPLPGNANYDYLVMPQVVAASGESYLSFLVNKDWMAAQGLTLTDLKLTVKEGMPYYGADGKVYRTTTSYTTFATTVEGGSYDATRINYGVTDTGIGTYEIGTSGLDMKTPNCGWHLTQLDTVGGLNEGAESKILLNGKSVAEWNTTDDSAWTYTDIGWPNDFHAGFHKPIVLNFTDDKMQIFIHPNLMSEFGNCVNLEIPEAFDIVNAEMTYKFEIPALETTRLYAKPVTVTVRLGGNPMDTSNVYTVDAKYGDTITLETPTADGKVFVGWVDINGNEITDWTVTGDTAIYANWTITPYTLTIKEEGQEDKTFTFGVETTMTGIDLTNADLAYVLEDNLPDDTADWDYEWAEEVPETFELKDYTFTVTKTEITTVDFTIQGEETTIEIPAGKTAQTYPRMAGDYTFSWTGDATIKVDGQDVTNGNVVTLWGSFVEIIPTDSSAVCTVVLTLTEYVEPVPEMVLGDNAYTIKIENYYAGEVVAQYTATEAGKYVLSAAEGEENAFVLIEGDYGAEMIDLPYEFELAEGESMKFIISTGANVLTTTEDEINLVLAKAPEYVIPEADSELTIPEAVELGEALKADSEGKYYVTGTIKSVSHTTYGNMTIEDADGNTIYVYGTYSADGSTRYDALETKPVAGDEVKLYSIVSYYDGAQLKNAWIVEFTDNTPDVTEPAADSELTISEAVELGEALKGDSTNKYYVIGTVKEIANETYGNMTIEDAEGNTIYVYGTYSADGATRYDSLETKPVVGDKVKLYSIVSYFNGAQLKNAWIIEIIEDEPVDSDSGSTPDSSSTAPDSSSTAPDSSSTAPDSSSTTDSSNDDSSASAGCFGSISGIAGGMMALGAFAGVMLKKKKEEENK